MGPILSEAAKEAEVADVVDVSKQMRQENAQQKWGKVLPSSSGLPPNSRSRSIMSAIRSNFGPYAGSVSRTGGAILQN